jgi:hypothetical protein
MPTTVYDSSLITSRLKSKTEADSFLTRIQNNINPTTGYAPMLGIWDQSIINSVKNGQMKYFRKNEGGCTIISNGCPCEGSINSGNMLLAPGPIPYITVTYGSVIVEWGEPISGTPPFTYVVYAISDSYPTVTSPSVSNRRYIFQTSELVSGVEYEFKVVASNFVGVTEIQTEVPIPAPYGSPTAFAVLNSDTPGSINLTITGSPFETLSESAEYNIQTYLDNILTSVSDFQPLGTTLPVTIPLNGLLSSYLYSFKVQIKDSQTEISSYSTGTTNIRPLPSGPQNVSWTALSSTSIRVSYNNFLAQAGGFNLVGATCIITNGYSMYLNTTNLTNTSVDIIDLSPNTTYYDFTLQFQTGSVNSLVSSIPTFTTLP